MGNLSITKVFEKLLSEPEFREQYFLAYLDRFVYNTTDLEKGLNQDERKRAIENLLEAFHYLMQSDAPKLSPVDISIVGDFINKDDGIEGFRKINVSAGKYAEWTPVPSNSIYYQLYSLLNNYYNVWNGRDVYEKEAIFHIELMRIHPFEDGNKRMSKIIMNANLTKQNYPPVIITESDTEIYYNFINNMDVEGFAKFLRERSLQELQTLISYYKIAHKIPITDSVYDTINYEEEKKR